jgi:16S rRNA (guanine527-N7)-methyltransferase
LSIIPLDVLKKGAGELGIELTDVQLNKFECFAELLIEKNKDINLTRIIDPLEIVTSHYLDSLTCLKALNLKPQKSVIDIGTGAGFPGIPLAIVRPDVIFTLADSTGKKIKFVKDAVSELGIGNVKAVHSRAEELGRNIEFREKFDVCYARALADLRIIVELCLPLVKLGGYLIAQKGCNIDEEIKNAKPITGQLGGVVEDIVEVVIPESGIRRFLVVIKKNKPTPEQFPRDFYKIKKIIM